MACCDLDMTHTLLGNTFVGKRGQLFDGSKERLYSAAAWGLDKHQTLSLKEMLYPVLVYDTFPKKVASPCASLIPSREIKVLLVAVGDQALLIRSQTSFMRSWLAGLMLAIRSQALLIFGLWLAVI